MISFIKSLFVYENLDNEIYTYRLAGLDYYGYLSQEATVLLLPSDLLLDLA
ncbi:hypothetical protein ACVR0S_04635 [Streptococcus dentapri]|uniref:Uncharacterized protein n=1 Tax=Streptococcus dentapri TaxID=573564 RepID=A0ABV8D3B3_9STRE